MNRPFALAIMIIVPSIGHPRSGLSANGSCLFPPAVGAEETRRREFAEFVADHVLSNVYGEKFLSVVYSQRETDHLGNDRPSRE